MAGELDRFYQLLEAGIAARRLAVGQPPIIRIRQADLEREAGERAFEARQQVGLDTHPDPEDDKIRHPDEAVMLQRLGWPSSINTTELATWGFLWPDPVAAAVDSRASDGRLVGLLNTEPHRSLLMNPVYSHWGAGHHGEFKPGDDVTNLILERHYWTVWLSDGVPVLPGPGPYAGFGTTYALPRSIRFSGRVVGRQFTQAGVLLKEKVGNWPNPSSATAGRRALIPGQPGVWLYIVNGAYAGYWVPEGTVSAGNT